MPPAADDAAPSSAAAPLNAAADVGATLSKDVHTKEWNGQVSENTFHLFVNNTAEQLNLSWGDEVYDYPHSTVAPRANSLVGTYNFHKWRVRSESRGLIASYTGPSVILTVTDDGYTTEQNPTGQRPYLQQPQPSEDAAAKAAGGCAAGANGGGAVTACGDGAVSAAASPSEPGYRQRGSVLGMPIWAFDCVSDAAVSRLEHVVGSMLAHSPPELLQRLVAGGASFAVFGTDQVVSDVPSHRFMRHNTGRDLDKSARGLGATPTVPVTSCGEENLTMQGDRWYPCQSILIHEVGHMVHNMGLPPGPGGVEGVLAAYRAATKSRLYPKGCYMMTNEQEYWAVAVESWFESTVRGDVNGGVKTRAALRRHDPALAAHLTAAFGDGKWRYWQDCPRPLAMPTRGSAAAAAAAPSQRQAAAAAGASAPAPTLTAAAAAVSTPPSVPSWRARRPTKLSVDSLMESAESSAAVRLLLRRLLCRRFLSSRRRRGSGAARAGDGAAAAAAAAEVEAEAEAAVQGAPEGADSGDGREVNGASAVLPAAGSTAAAAPQQQQPYLPPPLPLATKVRGGRRGADHRRKQAELAAAAAAEEEEEEEVGKWLGWPAGVEMPPPLPAPVPPMSAPPPSPPGGSGAAAVSMA